MVVCDEVIQLRQWIPFHYRPDIMPITELQHLFRGFIAPDQAADDGDVAENKVAR